MSVAIPRKNTEINDGELGWDPGDDVTERTTQCAKSGFLMFVVFCITIGFN